MEETFSGYCRTIDAARLVFCESDEGDVEIDCSYADCAYAAGCPVGMQITEFLKKARGECSE